jgi:hypothetical protein
MTILSKSIMNQDSMQKVRLLPLFGEWMGNDLLKLINFGFD